MMRKALWLVVLGGCLPIDAEVVTFHDSMDRARLEWCDNLRSDWCPTIDGKCVSVRIGPDQEPLAGDDNSETYDRMSACLLPCSDQAQCPIDHLCNEVTTNDGETTHRCVPRTFCRGAADCGQSKYGGHLFNSSCKPLGTPICRQVADASLLSCQNDADCTALHGEGAVCHLQACEFAAQGADSCLPDRFMDGECVHEPAPAEDPLSRLLGHLPNLGIDDSGCDLGQCNDGLGVCVSLTSGVQRCWPLEQDGACPPGWSAVSVSVEPRISNVKVCIPPVPCMPNGKRSGNDHERAHCPGLSDGHQACPSGSMIKVLSNRVACGEADGAQACPEGSSCVDTVCVVTSESSFEAWQMHSIPTCELQRR